MHFLEFISLPVVQSLIAFFTILLAFFSCYLTYRLSRPKIRVKVLKNAKYEAGFASEFAYTKGCSLATVSLSIENCSAHKTQIKDIYFSYKGKNYHAANVFTDYSKAEISPTITSLSKFPIKKDLLFSYIPIEIDSFQEKKLIFTFFDFPNIKKDVFIMPIRVSVAGKKLPILTLNAFTKIDIENLLHKYTATAKDGTTFTIESNVPLYDVNHNVISKKR